MNISLREINRENYRTIAGLQVKEDRAQFLDSIPWSLAQAKYEPELVPLGIYDDETPIGFAIYRDGDYGAYGWAWSIWGIMIDYRHQGRGYGRAAMQLLLARLRALSTTHMGIFIAFLPENTAAHNLYRSLGFENSGIDDGRQLIYWLPLVTTSPSLAAGIVVLE